MDILLEVHKNFLLLLLKYNVDYILIGGYAVIYHGYERGTGDIDIWLNPDNSNKVKLINALREHGIMEEDLQTISKKDFQEAQVFFLGKIPYRIDFLTKIQGVNYNEANDRKVFFPLKDVQVPLLDYQHLIINKILSGRPKDKIDVEELQKINQYKNKT